jgi:hypothetical protein
MACLEDEVTDLMTLNPDLFEGDTTVDMFSRFSCRGFEEQLKVNKIVEDDNLDEPAKIDAIAAVRGWFWADTAAVDAYLAGTVSASATAARMAEPIDTAYASANHGRQYYHSEMEARTQRGYCTSEEALIGWGPEQDFPEPDRDTDDLPSTGELLWNIWYSILHAAKRIVWYDESQQEKLVALVQLLKSRPDPPPPSPMTIPLKRDWIWGSGTVWSELLLLGPSVREAWNDSCGYGAGWTKPEQHAWINANAFVARLTVSGTASLGQYGIWALSELESSGQVRGLHKEAPASVILGVNLTVASVWVEIAGLWMYEHRNKDGSNTDAASAEVDFSSVSGKQPQFRDDAASVARWSFWRRRFEQESKNWALASEARERSARAAAIIGSFDKSSACDESSSW